MNFKLGQKIRIKEGVNDPDVSTFCIGGLVGTIEGIGDDYLDILLEEGLPQWVKDELDLQDKNTEGAVRLFIAEIEPAEQEKTDLETAIELIEGLRDSITVLPCYWAEFVGFDFALKVLRFLAKHKPEEWQEYLDEMEGNR